MTITTEDCKNFIESISSVINYYNGKWKRTKKYKHDNLVLRDFENECGRNLTLAESNGTLFLYQLDPLNTQTSINAANVKFGKQYFSKQPTENEVLQFMVDCIKQDNSIVDNSDTETVKDALNIKSWTIWTTWKQNSTPNQYNEEPLADFIDDRWNDFSLHFGDKNNQTVYINPQDLKQVFWLGMSDYDTAYRIYVYQTKDNTLYLGENDPD